MRWTGWVNKSQCDALGLKQVSYLAMESPSHTPPTPHPPPPGPPRAIFLHQTAERVALSETDYLAGRI